MSKEPYTQPVSIREFGEAVGQSYHAIRRLVEAGVAPVAIFPSGKRILPDWANRYRSGGLTSAELQRYRAFMREARKSQELKRERRA